MTPLLNAEVARIAPLALARASPMVGLGGLVARRAGIALELPTDR
ncbi:MAG: hypothetical protein ABI606_15850 [Rhodoferax sp.]